MIIGLAHRVEPHLREATVGDEPKASHKRLAIATPTSWAQINEGCPPGPSSIGIYAFPFCRDFEFLSGCEKEA
jgi:hypothetical protein